MSKLAEQIWEAARFQLDDRGCFHGIDDDTMEEIDEELVKLIDAELPSATQVAEAV